jgi:hypothetical protein
MCWERQHPKAGVVIGHDSVWVALAHNRPQEKFAKHDKSPS